MGSMHIIAPRCVRGNYLQSSRSEKFLIFLLKSKANASFIYMSPLFFAVGASVLFNVLELTATCIPAAGVLLFKHSLKNDGIMSSVPKV